MLRSEAVFLSGKADKNGSIDKQTESVFSYIAPKTDS
jgi:hypothetical protein